MTLKVFVTDISVDCLFYDATHQYFNSRQRLNDTRVLTTLSVLLGINLESPGEEEMDATPPQTRKDPKSKSKTQETKTKEEKMEEDISSEKKAVSYFNCSQSVLIPGADKAVVGPRMSTVYGTENSLNVITEFALLSPKQKSHG